MPPGYHSLQCKLCMHAIVLPCRRWCRTGNLQKADDCRQQLICSDTYCSRFRQAHHPTLVCHPQESHRLPRTYTSVSQSHSDHWRTMSSCCCLVPGSFMLRQGSAASRPRRCRTPRRAGAGPPRAAHGVRVELHRVRAGAALLLAPLLQVLEQLCEVLSQLCEAWPLQMHT